MANAELCQRIACGAVSQYEAGPETLYECSAAGYVGVLPCSNPACSPYLDELRALGMCPRVAQPAEEPMPSPRAVPPPPPLPPEVVVALPLHPPVQPDEGEAPLPPAPLAPADVVAAMPSVVARRPSPRPAVATRGSANDYYCRLMVWVSANPCVAAALVVAGWWFLARERGR